MTTIKLKNGSGAPAGGDLVQGEPALDLTNKRLYTENASGTVIEVGTNPTSVTTGVVTATSLDISGNIDVDGTTNLDVVDIDGAVDMASTLAVAGDANFNSGTLFVDTSTNQVGIGSTDPSADALGSADDLVIKNSASAGLTIRSADSGNQTIALGATSDEDYALIQGFYNSASPFVRTSISGQEITKVLSSGLNVTGTVTATSLDISGDIDVDGTTNLDVVDIDGAVDMASTLAVGGVVTANAGVTSSGTGTFGVLTVDTMTLNASSITGTSNLTIDVAGDITFDADGGEVILKDGSVTYGQLKGSTSDFIIQSLVSDKDIIFKGLDGAAIVSALTLDMSNAGRALFNVGASFSGDVAMGDNNKTKYGAGEDLILYSDGTNGEIEVRTNGEAELQNPCIRA